MQQKKLQNKPAKIRTLRQSQIDTMKQSINLINQHCKKDHLNGLLAKGSSLSQSTFLHSNLRQSNKQNKIVHQVNKANSVHLTRLNHQIYESIHNHLPSILQQSTYKASYKGQKNLEKIIKAKQKDSFFIKSQKPLPLISQYQNSFQKSLGKDKTKQIIKRQSKVPVYDSLYINKNSLFKGQTIYNHQYHMYTQESKNSYKFSIKNKDHLTHIKPLQSLEKSQYQKQFLRRPTKERLPKPNPVINQDNQHYFAGGKSTLGHFDSTYNSVYKIKND